MSINVTVTGNPVSINRGKMVTSDAYNSDNEFEKRRLMRLEQVRQQSKNIAEEVRNKVRREKKKCLGEIERQGKENLKCWQNKKLLMLQQQYKEALQDIGMGHREAEELADETVIMNEQREVNEQVARYRGKMAASKMQVHKNRENMKKAIPLQKKKLVRDIENTRSALVSNLKKKKSVTNCDKNCTKRRRASADINITIPSDSDSSEDDQQNYEPNADVQSMPSIPEECEEGSSFSSCECTKTEDEHRLPVDTNVNCQQNAAASMQDPNQNLKNQREQPSARSMQSYSQILGSHRSNIESFREAGISQNNVDRRISDRIKQREIMTSQPDYCDIAPPATSIPSIERSTKIRDSIDQRQLNRPNLYTFPEMENSEGSQSNILKVQPSEKSSKSTLNTNEMMKSGRSLNDTRRHYSDIFVKKLRPEENEKLNKFPTIVQNGGSPSKHKNLDSQRDQANNAAMIHPEYFLEHYQNSFGKNLPTEEAEKLRKFVSSTENQKSPNTRKVIDSHNDLLNTGNKAKHVDTVPARQLAEIPSKSAVKLKGVKVKDQLSEKTSKATLSTTDTNRVRFYDHANRFSADRDNPSSVHVEKIDSSSVEVIPNLVSEAEIREKMKQRDKEAQIRGKKALEKEKVQRDYDDMIKKLPMLQKIERISEISKDKPEYHMSEERLQELERKRQNDLENIFTREFPNLRPAIVTLPSKNNNSSSTKQPSNSGKAEESTQSINMAKWDVDYDSPKMFSAQEVREIVNAFTGQKTEDRRKKLKDLIRSLKMQEEQLLNEIMSLPQDDSTRKLINDLSSFIDDEKRRKHERKRRREENDSSAESISSSERHRRKHKSKVSSPKKKAKLRSKQVLVLQNMSTQTTPKPVKDKQVCAYLDKEPTLTDVPDCEKLHTICDCIKLNKEESNVKSISNICKKQHTQCYCETAGSTGTTSDELCQIFIKINDENEVPEVVVKSRELEKVVSPKKSRNVEKIVETKSVSTETEKEPKKTQSKPPKVRTDRRQKNADESKAKSWKEQLSKNSISTSSTSYLSPPDFLSTKHSTTGSSFYDSTKRNVSFSYSSVSNKSIDPRLLNYIKKLLSMSRISIDELAVSSSEVATPSQSVIEMESNNPLAQIQNVIKYYNIKVSDLAKELSYSDSSHKHDNTSVSTSTSGLRQNEEPKNSQTMIPEKESLTNQYADITDSCSKRIANLAAMIHKLREEKVKILQGQPVVNFKSPVNSDKDYSTAYLDLPHASDKSDKSKESSKNSSTQSWDDEELTKKLLEIDMSLADKLKRFPTNVEESGESSRSGQNGGKVTDSILEGEMDSADREFYERLKRLRETHTVPTLQPPHDEQSEQPSAPFVSFLDSIPKLPKLEALPPESATSSTNLSSTSSTRRHHPPPSKGLVVAKKFNEDISLVPHELSTIVEAESLMSTRVTPNTSKISPGKETSSEMIDEGEKKKSSGTSTDRSVPEISPEISVEITKKCNIQTCTNRKDTAVSPRVCTSVSCSDSSCKNKKMHSSSSNEDLETIESMLKSIGMEWAIPTLHKTQEALALTSSSSSSDLSKSKTRSTSLSEVSLSDFLKRQMLGKMSSSSLKTDASPSSLLDFPDLSAIQGNSIADKVNHRTSTPILHSKNTSKSKNSDKNVIFTEESEISSVRGSGKSLDKLSFHSLSDQSASQTK